MSRRPLGVPFAKTGEYPRDDMATPIDPTAAGSGTPSSRLEELRERLRPRTIAEPGESRIPSAERFALERVQALELQLSVAYQRERELTELAVRDGNRVAELEARVTELAATAERAEAAERALFEAETRTEAESRRAELMEAELQSTRAEVDALRTRVVELEASLRRALAEVGEATATRARRDREEAAEEAERLERSAERSLELADKLRRKVSTLESSLRSVMHELDDVTAARLRAEDVEAEIEAADRDAVEVDARVIEADARAAEAETRLAELEARLSSLDERIAGLSESVEPDDDGDGDTDDIVVDLREAEPAVERPVQPPPSRWSEWRAT